MYELSQNIKCHNRDLRCLDHHAGYIATGGADKVFKLLSIADGKIETISSYDLFEKNILSIRLNKLGGKTFVLVGSADGKIHAFDHHGSPVGLYEHNSQISSLDFID